MNLSVASDYSYIEDKPVLRHMINESIDVYIVLNYINAISTEKGGL